MVLAPGFEPGSRSDLELTGYKPAALPIVLRQEDFGGTERTRTVISLIDNQVPHLSATVPNIDDCQLPMPDLVFGLGLRPWVFDLCRSE